MQVSFLFRPIFPIKIVPHFFGIGCGDFSWCGFHTPVIGAIVLIDKFGKYVYLFDLPILAAVKKRYNFDCVSFVTALETSGCKILCLYLSVTSRVSYLVLL